MACSVLVLIEAAVTGVLLPRSLWNAKRHSRAGGALHRPARRHL
jgi:hypothetical protein